MQPSDVMAGVDENAAFLYGVTTKPEANCPGLLVTIILKY